MDSEAFAPQLDMSNSTKKRKRVRAIQACERCRTKKYKCDEQYPACAHCKKAGIDCTYGRSRPRNHEPDLNYVRSLEARVDELAASLRYYAADGDDANSANLVFQEHHPESTAGAREQLSNCAVRQWNNSTGPLRAGPSTVQENLNAPDSQHDGEITDLNQHTNEIEFHGSTSSMAFLEDLRKLRRRRSSHHPTIQDNDSLVSALHNSAFSRKLFESPKEVANSVTQSDEDKFYFAQAHVFVHAYFSGVHFVHPIIDKDSFMSRASDLWFRRSIPPSASFLALYLSVMALGALMMTWQDEALDGLTRFQWSRRLFSEALTYLNQLQFSNDLDTVHSLYVMAKICQNELNPHLAWMYLGRAVRTCISAGFNRNTHNVETDRSEILSRTWWGLFSLEIETSFSLGRADTLGQDEYHNRPLPQQQDGEFAIIACMVKFGHIVRRVSLLYNAKPPGTREDLAHAFQLEADLDVWLETLPSRIRPGGEGAQCLSALREPDWCRRQKLVLEIRYHMVKMALFRYFMDMYIQKTSANEQAAADALFQCTRKCIDSARQIIDIMYEAYKVHVYFRTWWYNTTYIMMAAAALLSYIKRAQVVSDASLVRWVEMAMEILDAMDESVVARKCAEILRRHLEEPADADNALLSLATVAVDEAGDSFNLADQVLMNDQLVDYQILDYSFGDMASLFQGFNDIGAQ